MPRRQFPRLRGLANNRRRLLEYVGYSSIRTFRRDNDGYNTNDQAYRDILNLYNQQQDLLENQIRDERRALQQQQRTTNRLTTNLMRQVRNRIETPSQAEQTINVDLNALRDLRPLFNQLIPELTNRNRRMYMKSGQRIYMLNSQTIPRLEQVFQPEYIVEQVDSATEILVAINEAGGDFDLVLLPTDIEGNQQVEGGLFPFNHLLDKVDLRRYAIFHKNTNWGDECNDHNCLITSLKSADIDTTGVEEYVKNQFVPQKYLKSIAGVIKRYIIVKPLYSDKGGNNLRKYGDEKDPVLNLGLVKSHYFLIEPTEYTGYAIQNYFDVCDEKDFNIIYKKQTYYKRDATRKIDSFALIKILLENEKTHLCKFEGLEIYKMNNYTKYEEDIFKSLDYDDGIHEFVFDKKAGGIIEKNENGCLERNKPKDKNKKRKVLGIDYFDFETSTKRKDGIQVNHKPYLVCCSELNGGFYGDDCGKKLLDYYTHKYGIELDDYPDETESLPVFILIAHNSGYDFRFLLEHFSDITTIEKGTGLMTARCTYYYRKYNKYAPKGERTSVKKLVFEIRDSLKMINMPLSKFGKSFGMEIKKEILPYDLYTEENIAKKFIDVDECLSFLPENLHKEYLANVKAWDCYYNKKKQIDILMYSYMYCRMDCAVLKQGYEKFRQLCLDAINLDILDHISLASVSNEYLVVNGCYDDVLKVAGVPRAFIQKCIVGGRTMTAENKKYNIQDRQLADFDAVSLYPSGMARMKGFLKGKPKIITGKFKPDSYDGFFVCIRITDVKKHLKFPLLSYINDKGVRTFTNDMAGRIVYIDKVGLEDAIKYQGIEYEFVNGYYYDEGHNPTINSVIKHLFTERLKYKKQGNPLQLVFKECMNSSYGKSYLKPIDTDNDYVKNDDWLKFINRNFNLIKQATPLANGKGYKVTCQKPVNRHFNNAQVGVEILSITKRIMNEVMVLAEDLDLDIFYQDTDSIHIEEKNIKTLADEYGKIHGRDLIGKQMGQFHTDFDLDGSVGDIVAVKSIFLGKKAYVDKLKSKDKDGNDIYGYHIRLKGVPESSIKYKADQDYGGDVFKIYEELFAGNQIEFDLLAVKPKFELKRDMTIVSKREFKRKVKF
jgi:hypothetical protein